MTVLPPSPFELWQKAAGDPVRYRELMVEHGHVVPNEPCPECGQTFRHRHDGAHVVLVDIFGHDERGPLLARRIL